MLNAKKIIAAGLAAATLASGFAVATDASAQSRYRRDRDHTGAAVAAGIAGLAVGAALASNNRGYAYGYAPGYYYDRGYYGRGYYAPPPRYYAPRYYGPRTCVYWQYDRWGRAYQVRGRC
jgi:hypothetical protein